MLPKRPRAADLVLPESRLRLVDTERRRRAERSAVLLGRQVLVVEAVSGFVQHAEECLVEVPGVIARGDPTIAWPMAGAERVRRRVEPAGVEIETDRRRGRLGEHCLTVHRKFAVQ